LSSDIKGVLGKNLRVAKEYEIAVGAAMGDYIDGIVLDSADDVEQALGILEEKSEKGALIPLGHIYPVTAKKNFEGEEGVIAWAPELVLGNTWIVKDQQSAGKLLSVMRTKVSKEGLASARVITLLGEVFYATGQIRTSSAMPPASLSRKRQQSDLQGEIARLESQINETRNIVGEIEKDIQSAREKEYQLINQVQEARQKTEETAAAHRREIISLERVNRDFQWREEQIQVFARDIESNQAKIRETEGELELLDARILDSQNQVGSEQEELRNIPIDNLQADLSHWATRLEILKQGLRAAQARQTERDQLHSASLSRQTGIENSIRQVREARMELESQIEELKQNSKLIAVEIGNSSNDIVPSEAALEGIEIKLSEFLRLESRERVLTSQAEQVFTQARITQIRKQEALDGLRRQIEADFGLVAFEYHEDVSGPTPLPLEGIVEQLPLREEVSPGLEESLKRQRSLLRRIGPINPEAQVEYQDVSERFEFLSSQVEDLQEASEDVLRVIAELDEIMQREFCNTFDAVAEEFRQIFGRLFGGGSARLILTDPEDLTNTGIDIEARLPGRREQGLSLLSGGERSLTAVALVFSLLRVSPTPFCVLDEVDAMLDEANVGRFRELLRELSETTQFIMITHNRATVQVADIIYGVTMGRDSTSQILSLKVDELEKVIK